MNHSLDKVRSRLTIEILQGRRGKLFVFWRARASNGRIVAIGGEPFCSVSNAMRAARALLNMPGHRRLRFVRVER